MSEPATVEAEMTIPEAAKRLRCNPRTVRRRILRGEIAAQKRITPTGWEYTLSLPSVTTEKESQ